MFWGRFCSIIRWGRLIVVHYPIELQYGMGSGETKNSISDFKKVYANHFVLFGRIPAGQRGDVPVLGGVRVGAWQNRGHEMVPKS